MQIKIEAVQIAESFNIKKLRSEFKKEAHSTSTSEIFYKFEENKKFLYVFDYGVVVFANYNEVEKSDFIKFVKNYATTNVNENLFEEYKILIDSSIPKFIVKNDFVTVNEIDASILKIVMLNIGQ